MNQLIVIGGSAGSLQPLQQLLQALPTCHQCIFLLVIHRQRNVSSILDHLLSNVAHCEVEEPDDKTMMQAGRIYLAPQNYHMLVEDEGSLALEYSEPEHFSRPSIDVTMTSASVAFGNKVTGVLLSGANADGAEGLHAIAAAGGKVLIQDPEQAEFPVMPEQAILRNPEASVLTLNGIARHLQKLCL